MSNYIPQKRMDVITYKHPNLKKGAPFINMDELESQHRSVITCPVTVKVWNV